jgi:predicted NBD/HSP70 family sugar kinase
MRYGKILPLQSSPRSRDAVVAALRGARGGLTRSELMRVTGLSRPTVTLALEDLAQGSEPLVTHTRDAPRPGAAGPQPNRYRLTPPAGLYVGVDFGQGHITVRVGDASGAMSDNPPDTLLVNVPALGFDALEEAAKLVKRAVRSRRRAKDIKKVVMGVPAPVTGQGLIASPNYLSSWEGVPIGEQFGEQLEETLGLDAAPPVAVENDANLGVVGETTYGVARGYDDVIYIKASTGIGCGILRAGKLWHGHHHFAGELGHVGASARALAAVEVVEAGLLHGRENCLSCGRPDCVQNLASTRSITTIVRTPDKPHERRKYAALEDFDAVLDAAQHTARRYPRALHAVHAAGIVLGSAIADLARVFDPAAVVLGGYLARAETLVRGPIEQALVDARIPHVDVLLVPTDRVPKSEVEGAVALALDTVGPRP